MGVTGMDQSKILDSLRSHSLFGRNDIWEIMNSGTRQYSKNTAYALLQQYLKAGSVSRVGRNKYTVTAEKTASYEHQYSEQAEDVARSVLRDYPYLDFTVFELVQLNRFVNHQIGHNVIFLSVESDLGDYVFDRLKTEHPGHVLNHPSVELYDQYWTDDLIIINRLLTEAPKGINQPWHTSLEKLLVDLMAEPLYQEIIHRGEYPSIYEGAFQNYVIDESRMFRYARRRNAADRLRTFIAEETSIQLRTVK